MKIDWNPSIRLKEILAKAHKLHEQGISWNRIAPMLGVHRTIIYALKKWEKEQKGGVRL